MADPIIHRVGLGTDLHRLESGGPLRLGGVDVPAEHHAVGHSDADVVLHALIDALLGAAGLPDIGEHFPDADPRHKGRDSRELLIEALAEVRRLGLEVANVDVVIQLERPRLTPHKEAIRASLSALLALPVDRVAVKAKTHEGLDAIGRGEAVGCLCAVGVARLSK